jgi:hypothetical protein
LNDRGFGWKIVPSSQALNISLDPVEPMTGRISLRLDWGGEPNPPAPIVTQLVLVQPGAHYRLHFAARTRDLVTGGPPVIIVKDPSSAADGTIGTSAPILQGSGNWQDYSIDFTTGKGTQAIQITLERQSCKEATCPIFGKMWLDDFSLQRFESVEKR